MSRCAATRSVLYIEEPLFDTQYNRAEVAPVSTSLWRLVPHLASGLTESAQAVAVREMIASTSAALGISRPIHWFYTPMMLPYAEGLPASLTVYDCMDELSQFAYAPPELTRREAELMARADLMFTGGMALYEHKRSRHHNVHGVPSSVDTRFFAAARNVQRQPDDQAPIASPRIGYCGVIDERIDLRLIERIATERPDWQLVLVGPVVKIDQQTLPRRANIHYLGGKAYEELPAYLSGWDAAIMPFALNDATRFISPTKTPEYLAAGRPVVSTAIRDVVEPYERLDLVRIGRDADGFIAHLDRLLSGHDRFDARAREAFLATLSWDATWDRMAELMRRALAARTAARTVPHRPVVEAAQAHHV